MKAFSTMKLFISLLILGVISSSSLLEINQKIMQKFKNSPVPDLFEIYHFIFSKTYEMNSEEGMERMKNFAENVRFIKENESQLPSLKIDVTSDLPHYIWKTLNNINNNLSGNFSADKITIGTIKVKGYCLTLLPNNEVAEMSPVDLRLCKNDNSPDQNWKLMTAPKQYGYRYTIVHANSGLFLARDLNGNLIISAKIKEYVFFNDKFGPLKTTVGKCYTSICPKNDCINGYLLSVAEKCDSRDSNQFFHFDHNYAPLNSYGNIKIAGKCVSAKLNSALNSTIFNLVECTGSDLEGFEFKTVVVDGRVHQQIIHKGTNRLLTSNLKTLQTYLSVPINSNSGDVTQFFMLGSYGLNSNDGGYVGGSIIAKNPTGTILKPFSPKSLRIENDPDPFNPSLAKFLFSACLDYPSYPASIGEVGNGFPC